MELKPSVIYGIIGVVGAALTYAVATPGSFEISFGMLRFDPYYATMTGFVCLVGIAVGELLGLSIPDRYYHPKLRE